MKDGHLNKCKECTKIDSLNQYNILKQNPEWIEKERERGRKKYHKYKYKSNPIYKQKAQLKYREKYPEKYKAASISQHIKKLREHRHHWSYQKQHWKDVIHLKMLTHYLLHRHLIYDQKTKLFKTKEGKLLDSKQKHIDYLKEIEKGE